MSTWTDANWPGLHEIGFLFSGVHNDCNWWIRTHPEVKKVFAHLYGTEELLVSMDVMISYRPWWKAPPTENWKPVGTENLHSDQNPKKKHGFQCIQGMIPLLPVTPEIGGLQLVPHTHTDAMQEWLSERFPMAHLMGDFM